MTLQDLIDEWIMVDDVHPDGELKTTEEMAEEFAAIFSKAYRYGLGDQFHKWAISNGHA